MYGPKATRSIASARTGRRRRGTLLGLAVEAGRVRHRAMLEKVRAAFPDVVKEVRGRGLMLGFEFHDQARAEDPTIQHAARGGLFGYLIAGHLLNRHAIRTFPTASAVHTLRFEPSVLLTDEEIERLEAALTDVCVILREQTGQRLLLSCEPQPEFPEAHKGHTES